LALTKPERISALILESASPVNADSDERTKRRASDEELASMIERDGLEAFIDYWASIPLFASQQKLLDEVRARQRRLRLAQRPIGLANSLRGMGAGAMDPVIDRLSEYRMPVLYVAGEYDDKYHEMRRGTVGERLDAKYVE